ncbi:MAG: insulinase family protein [Rhodobacter sp.]|nr:insulinase family protein [Rhodobacter sp.]MCA3458212.1 insulinase family protein [Rhodobacter sp.]MCA3462737.1 insulinase family protein [Rhodobacter sp.]MCA3463491.1 insulinase family protein [Rhodobacter sp.]MCA3466747.1 insulinase family protein [Rhodobacter sp.]
MIRMLRSAFVLLSLASPALAETVTDFTLPNGLQVVVIEDHRAPVVVHMVWYRVGAADEPPGHSGIAHFLEHLMFKGTDEVPSGKFSEIVQAQGGSDNAFTSWDYTAYFQRVAADRLDLVMKLEADRMRDLRLTQEDVVTERAVILEERTTRTDSDPGALFGEQAQAAQYLNHPYGIPIIGWRHEIEQLDRDDALAFYRRFYAPNNAVLVVAGDVTPDEVKRLAERHYGPLAPTEGLPPRIRPSEPPQLAERRLSMADPRVAQPYVVRSYLAPERNSGAQDKAAALTILAYLLGGSGTTSVLARKLTFDTQTAVYASAFYSGDTLDTGTFGLIVAPAPGVSLPQAEAAMDEAIAQFLKDGVDPAALDRMKTQIRAEQIYADDNTSALANLYGEALAIGLTVADVQAWPDVLQAVTAEDVMAAAQEVLDRRTAVTGYLEAAGEQGQ